MRLDKLLGQAGYGSRNQVKKLIRSRQVYVDGVLADRDNLNVDASLQSITVSGKELEHAPEVYYLMNKPGADYQQWSFGICHASPTLSCG